MAGSGAEVSCILDSAKFIKLPSMVFTLLSQTLFFFFNLMCTHAVWNLRVKSCMGCIPDTGKKNHKAALKDSETEDWYYLWRCEMDGVDGA